jgi:hypothetical protein
MSIQPAEDCAICARVVPPRQMASGIEAVRAELGIEVDEQERLDEADTRLDQTVHATLSATQAWQCDRCGRWICNDCILPFVLKSHGRRMRHRTCGGVFKAPDSPSSIGVRGQRPVASGSWRSRFGIRTT